MITDEALTKRQKELVAAGASIAAGCRPCTTHHFDAARDAGATDAEIRRAVDGALGVCEQSTRLMAALAEQYLGVNQE